MGAVGQGARVVVGLKKQHDVSSRAGRRVRDDFCGKKLTIGLLIGFIAGVLAAIPMHETVAAATPAVLLGLVAAGYSGTDFIEGFARREAPHVGDDTAQRRSERSGPQPVAGHD